MMIKGTEITESRIAALYNEILTIRERMKLFSANGHQSDRLSPQDMLRDLEVSLEELHVAYEELIAQNEALLEARQELELEHRRYRELFELAPDPYLVTDLRGKILEANLAASKSLGTELSFLKGKLLFSYVATEARRDFRARVEVARELTEPQEWGVRIQPRHRPPFDAAVTVGITHRFGKEPVVLHWIIRDITDRKRSEERLRTFNDRLELTVAARTEELEKQAIAKDELLRREKAARMNAEEAESRFRFLAEAAEIMSSSLCYETTLQTVAHMAVPRLANWCFVDIAEEDGSIWRLAVASDNPVAERLGRRLLHQYGSEETNNRLVAAAIATGRSELIMEISDGLLEAIAQDSHHLALLKALAPTSVMVVPLVTRGRTLGAMTFVATTRAPYTMKELDLAEELAHRAALAVDNARLYRRAQTEIEEREKVEERLLRSEKRFRHLFESGMISIAFFDNSGRITSANDAFLAMTGYGREEMAGEEIRWEMLTPPEWQTAADAAMESLRLKGYSEPHEQEMIARDGRRFPVVVGGAMAGADEGVGYVIDLSTIKESETRLQERMKQLETIYAITATVARAHDLDEIYADAVVGLRESLKVDRASILLTDDGGVMRFKHSHGLSEGYRRAVEGHSPWGPETTDPQPIAIESVADEPSLGEELRRVVMAEGIGALAFIPLVHDGELIGKFMLYYDAPHVFQPEELRIAQTIARDIAIAIGKRRIEEALRASEHRFRAFAESNIIGVFSSGLDGPISWGNDEFLRIVGYAHEDLAAGVIDWHTLNPPESEERSRAAIEELMRSGFVPPHEKEYVRKDGRHITVLLGLALIDRETGATIGFVLDISASKQSDREMRRAKEEAEEMSRAKDRFLAILSHELRTPLTPVIAAAQVLDTDESLPAELRPMVEIILRNAELQGRLIDDLLDLTRIVKGKLKLDLQRVDVHAVLDSAVAICRPEMQRRGIELAIDLAATATHAQGDPGRLQQVFWNILKNATKFTPPGGRIAIATHNRDGRIVIAVTDSGKGIAAEDLDRIFMAFEQVEDNGYAHREGLGLGLAVGRALAEQQGGSLDAASEGPGKGATFTVTLPTLPPPTVERASTPADRPSARILLVEDHADTRRVLDLLLTHRGYEVVTASSVEAAMALAERERFEILLSDLSLPDGSGLDLVRAVRRTGGSIKAIALSGYNAPEDAMRSREAGFDEHLGKPVDSRKLCAAIDRLIGKGE